MNIKAAFFPHSDDAISFPFLWKGDSGNIYYCFNFGRSLCFGSQKVDDSDINHCWPRRLPRGAVVTLTVE